MLEGDDEEADDEEDDEKEPMEVLTSLQPPRHMIIVCMGGSMPEESRQVVFHSLLEAFQGKTIMNEFDVRSGKDKKYQVDEISSVHPFDVEDPKDLPQEVIFQAENLELLVKPDQSLYQVLLM